MSNFIQSLSEKDILDLYEAQEIVYRQIADCTQSITDLVLIGGTALSRCYLHHRISFDLDFALNPWEHSIEDINRSLKKIKNYEYIRGNNDSKNFYASAFYKTNLNDINIEFSFIEDKQYSKFKKAERKMGKTFIHTVTIDTLYYNKLRTIGGDFLGTGRLKIRDFFDIFVLSRAYKKLDIFLDSIPKEYKFDIDKFYDSLADFNWYNTINQYIFPLNQWKKFDNPKLLSDSLFEDIGAVIVENEIDGDLNEYSK